MTPENARELFPEPPGMEEYRAALAATAAAKEEARKKTIEFQKQ